MHRASLFHSGYSLVFGLGWLPRREGLCKITFIHLLGIRSTIKERKLPSKCPHPPLTEIQVQISKSAPTEEILKG